MGRPFAGGHHIIVAVNTGIKGLCMVNGDQGGQKGTAGAVTALAQITG